MILNIVDLELNQPSRSIIQIGAIQFNVKTGETIKELDLYINPAEPLDQYIIDLTGITQEQVDSGIPLTEGLKQFWAFLEGKQVAAWGSDLVLLKAKSLDLEVETPERLTEMDLMPMANILRCAIPNGGRGGLRKTMATFGLEFAGRPHNALTDARNTARLVSCWVGAISSFYKIQEVVNVEQKRSSIP